jgi:hypothetical protein
MFLQSFSGAALAASTAAAQAPRAGQAAGAPAPQGGSGSIVLTEKEYFEGPGYVFLAYHNNNSNMQGGLQILRRGERLLDSGSLLLTPKGEPGRGGAGGRAPSSGVQRRVADREHATATLFGQVGALNMGYQIVCRTDGQRMFVTLKFDKALDWSNIEEAGFQMYLYPAAYYEKSFSGDSLTGVFSRLFNGETVLGRTRNSLRIAPEDPICGVTFERRDGEFRVEDARGISGRTAWFRVVAPIEPGSTATELEIVITTPLDPQWRRPALIAVQQVGYHPGQPKQAVIELDPREDFTEKASLYKMGARGQKALVKAENPKPWGRFFYYKYATFDFSEVTDPGVYVVEFQGQTTGPIRIDRQVYEQAWRPTLEVFLPVQMCHVAVLEGNRSWHGACHVDDALQAPANRVGLDGYQQGKLETRFADYEHIPGLNWGGWHDAGDHDLPGGSMSPTTLALALAQEEFHPGSDMTTVRRADRTVLLHVPDGEEDLLQQIEYGVEGLMASYRAAGFVFAGIIESTRDQYDHTGDPVNITDNLVYDSSLKPDQVVDGRCGKRDDRWAYTNRNTGLQYKAAQTFAAASRVLRAKKPALADECLAAAGKLWEYEQGHTPVYAPGSYAGRGGISEEIEATAELWLTTDDARYQKRLFELLPQATSGSPEQFGGGIGWVLARLLPKVSDPAFRNTVQEQAKKWKAATDAMEATNPYGIRFPSRLLAPDWKLDSAAQARGDTGKISAWDLQTAGMHHYFYHKHMPEIFDANSLFRAVSFVLGCHPATDTSCVSGVGLNSQLIAYGVNRDDWTYIPGGVISGISLVKPDFIELKNFPYHWYQTEYVIHGAASYIFVVLATQWLLEHPRSGSQA